MMHLRSGNLLVHRTRKAAFLVRKKQGRRLLPNAAGEEKRLLCSEFGNGTTNMWHYWFLAFLSSAAMPQLPGSCGQPSGRIWPSQEVDPTPLSHCREGPCEPNHLSSTESSARRIWLRSLWHGYRGSPSLVRLTESRAHYTMRKVLFMGYWRVRSSVVVKPVVTVAVVLLPG
jgi:hypothetical protein